jgi:hypothetical protein
MRLQPPLRLVPRPESASVADDDGETTPYGRAALEDELTQILRARQGSRNNALNRSVFKLAQLVAEHRLARQELEESAFEVALLVGLTPLETKLTLASAIQAGLRSPRR